MKFPTLNTKSTSRSIIEEFRGYDHNMRISDGAFYETQNLTTDDYPVFSPRKARGFYVKPASPQGMIAKDKLCYVDGSNFIYGDTTIPMNLSVEDEDCPKQLVSMGAYVVIFPDKKYVNTADISDYGSMEATAVTSGTVTFTQCHADGTAVSGESTIETTTYVKIAATGINVGLSELDGVTISGVTADTALNGSHIIQTIGDGYIVIIGDISGTLTQTDTVTVSRTVPIMDYVTECGNRLWGCRYGLAANGEQVNEIYACKLGDFKNWNALEGLSTDSYTASCGTDGPFTGAVTHLGYPLFFKENCFHKVYGSYPSAFQITVTECRGVQEGCSESLAIVNETLFYKARSGVCSFDGSMPTEISDAFGKINYSQAVGGAWRDKYYISMYGNGSWNLFVYDTATGIWMKEDDLHVSAFAALGDEMYAVDADNLNILALQGSGAAAEEQVSWSAETGDMGLSSPDGKYIVKLSIRMKAARDASADIYAQYDSDGEWIHQANIHGMSLASFSVPIRPRRCDHMRLKITGKGDVKIYSITKSTMQGGEPL